MSAPMSDDMFINYQVYVKNIQAKGQEPQSFKDWINAYVKSLKHQLSRAYKTLNEHGIEIEPE